MTKLTSLALGSLILVAGLGSLPVRAGSESSGGGADDYRIVPAFFRSYSGERPINACMEVSKDFGIDEQVLKKITKQAFKSWAEYIQNKNLTLAHDSYLIRTQMALVTKCSGDEELTVYFGVENETVAKYRGQFSKPFGFAQLTQEEGYNRKAQGFIWIAPPRSIKSTDTDDTSSAKPMLPHWGPKTQDALAGLVLHEMGHVFGNGHVDGTVMTPRIGHYLEIDTSPTAHTSRNVALYSKIDSQIELVSCMECRTAYASAETFDPLAPPGEGSNWTLTFKTLMGRDPVSTVAIRFERLGDPLGSGILTLMDATGFHAFDVVAIKWITGRKDNTPLFNGQGGSTFFSTGDSYLAKIKTKQGGEILVAVNYNMMDEVRRGYKAEIIPLSESASAEFYGRPIFVSAD